MIRMSLNVGEACHYTQIKEPETLDLRRSSTLSLNAR